MKDVMNTLEEFARLPTAEKMQHLSEELRDAFSANSISYDLNEMFVLYPNYESLVWNAAMLLVEDEICGLVQIRICGQIRWLMVLNPHFAVVDDGEFHCPLAKKKIKNG